MKTIEIQSPYDGLFVAYQIWVYSKKGEHPYGCPSLNREHIQKRCDDVNNRAPYYCDIYETVIFEAYVREITITFS